MHFAADTYWKSSECPWTFFAYPRCFADVRGLPFDEEAVRLLTALRRRGVEVGIWTTSPIPDTFYFACPFEEHRHLNAALEVLIEQGELEPDFCSDRTEVIFSLMGG